MLIVVIVVALTLSTDSGLLAQSLRPYGLARGLQDTRTARKLLQACKLAYIQERSEF